MNLSPRVYFIVFCLPSTPASRLFTPGRKVEPDDFNRRKSQFISNFQMQAVTQKPGSASSTGSDLYKGQEFVDTYSSYVHENSTNR